MTRITHRGTDEQKTRADIVVSQFLRLSSAEVASHIRSIVLNSNGKIKPLAIVNILILLARIVHYLGNKK